jgi:hypothetical protein
MFRILSAFVVAGLLLAFVGAPVVAKDEAKEETLKGKITCSKCDLGVTDACQTVVKVGDKVYYFDKASNTKYHKEICKEAKDGTVTGKVTKDGDKMVVTVSKVEFK